VGWNRACYSDAKGDIVTSLSISMSNLQSLDIERISSATRNAASAAVFGRVTANSSSAITATKSAGRFAAKLIAPSCKQ